jgi:hypothetical protein
MAVVFPIGKSVLFAAIAAALLTACGQAPGQATPSGGNSAITSTAVPAPGHWRIIPLALAAGALQQCSREVPPAGDAPLRFFMPKPADIADFEAKLSDHLTSTGYFEEETPVVRDNLAANGVIPTETRATFAVTLASGWTREYIGVERDSVQHIYGNYGLISPPIPGRPIVEDANVVCDGGPTFFGADYAIDNGEITHVAFNGHR